MIQQVLQDLGVTRESVRGAIKGLVESNPQLKDELREIVGADISGLKRVGEINGQDVFVRL